MDLQQEMDTEFEEDDPAELSLLNETVDSELLSRGSSFASTLEPSPKKTARSSKNSADGNFKVPKPPGTIFGLCSICGKGLKTETGLSNHIKTHKWKEAAKQSPPVDNILEHCRDKCLDIIQSFLREDIKHGGKYSKEYSQCLEALQKSTECSSWTSYTNTVCNVISNGLSGDKCEIVLPASLVPVLRSAISQSFSSEEFRQTIMNICKDVCGYENSSVWVITLDLLRKLADEVLIFVCQGMRVSSESVLDIQKRLAVGSKHETNHSIMQVIHYAAGSVLKGHVRLAKRHRRNKNLQKRLDCILSRFATVGAPTVVDRKSPGYWTSLISRKSLLFLKEDALPFFLELGKVLFSLERPDGSNGHDQVMDRVCADNHLKFLWNSVVGNALDSDSSFSFMVKVVRGMTNTYGRGAMLRRMNLNPQRGKRNKTTLSVGHRALLL